MDGVLQFCAHVVKHPANGMRSSIQTVERQEQFACQWKWRVKMIGDDFAFERNRCSGIAVPIPRIGVWDSIDVAFDFDVLGIL